GVLRHRHGWQRFRPPALALLSGRLRGPHRRMIGTELLDDPHADPVAVGEQLRDIARLNALFGGTRAVVRELESFFAQGTRDGGLGTSTTWTLLDVGTGLGDIPRAAAAVARKYGIALRLLGIEVNRTAARLARGSLSMILADGGAATRAPLGRCDCRQSGPAPLAAPSGGTLDRQSGLSRPACGGARRLASLPRGDGRRVGGVARARDERTDTPRRGGLAAARIYPGRVRGDAAGGGDTSGSAIQARLSGRRILVTKD